VSSQAAGIDVDLSAVNGKEIASSGVEHAAELVAFTEASMGRDDDALEKARANLRAALTPAAFVDTCATIGAFNVVDRIADATGIPLDDMMQVISAEVREELDLARFASSANTPGASG
jgi:hypothetical protein